MRTAAHRAGAAQHHRQRRDARQHHHRKLAELGAEYFDEDGGLRSAAATLGTVEDIGHAALFLASDEAGYITGQTLVIDGGQVLPELPQAVQAAKERR